MAVKKHNSDISLGSAISNFITAKKASGLSQATLDNYSLSLQVFMRDNNLDHNMPANMIDNDILQDWLISKRAGGIKEITLAHYLRDVRVFLYWLFDNCPDINSFKIKSPSTGKQPVKIYTDDELKSLLAMPDKSDSYCTWRCWLLANLMLGTGARIRSLCWLKKSDISDTSITFNVTKNKQVLTVPLSASLKLAIKKYLSIWDIDSEFLLLSSKCGAMLTQKGALHNFETYCAKRGVRSLGLHAFRHTYAYKLYQSGTDLVTLQYLLGHSDINTTRSYIGSLNCNTIREYSNPLDEMTRQKKYVRRRV